MQAAESESVRRLFAKLKQLVKDCNYRSVSANVCQSEAIRDAFISGLLSTLIRSRLLENIKDESMTLEAIFNQARCFDMAQKSSESYIATDGKAIEVSPVSAIKKPCDACIIRQQMKKCECCGANQLHKSFSVPPKEVSVLNAVAMDI